MKTGRSEKLKKRKGYGGRGCAGKNKSAYRTRFVPIAKKLGKLKTRRRGKLKTEKGYIRRGVRKESRSFFKTQIGS